MPKLVKSGLNIFYYGKGKGKTTAALGLAVRAAGAGMNVFILQFVKAKRPANGRELQSGEWPISSELVFFEVLRQSKAFKKSAVIGRIEWALAGAGFVGILGDRKPRAEHTMSARQGLLLARKVIKSGKYQLVILDELVSALELNLISEKSILRLIKGKSHTVHLVYTGHDAYPRIIAASDLVSEIKMIKHPYYQGVLAQKGIDF